MGSEILYHGSQNIINPPIFGAGKPYNDYGRGFYCTKHIELAKEWACVEEKDGYVNRYALDMNGLKVLNLLSEEYNILNWLALLLKNRETRLTTSLSKAGKDYLLRWFLPEYENYDLIVGYRADDSYFSFVRSFLNNEISLRQLGSAMRLGKLGEQYVLKSEKAFEKLMFLDFCVAGHSVYHVKRTERDAQARTVYQKELESVDLDGIFMRDIMREEMKPDDERLR